MKAFRLESIRTLTLRSYFVSQSFFDDDDDSFFFFTQAGYGTIYSTNYFSIPVSDENKLFNSSNVNVPGRWAFRVDGGPEDGNPLTLCSYFCETKSEQIRPITTYKRSRKSV